ncbi:MAG: hypothetical protein GX181_09385 [Synergistaceae bacterium]|nr:hypothetical protein [Synergistaceae bacterium]
MRRILLFLAALVFIACLPSTSAAAVTLSELERDVGDSPEVLLYTADLAEKMALEERDRASSGLRFFAEATVGGLNMPVSRADDSRIEGYARLSARAGVSIPLFGSWSGERIRLMEAHIRTLQSEQRSIAFRRTNLTALRKAYILVWTSQRKAELLERFVRLEGFFMPLLKERTRTGFLLEGDRLEMESWFALVRRDAVASALAEEQAMSVIRKATGRYSLEKMFAAHPDLSPLVYSRKSVHDYVHDDNRELVLLQEITEEKKRIADRAGGSQYESYLAAGYVRSLEDPGRYGSEGYASLTFSIPAGAGRAARAAREAALAVAEMAEQEEALFRLDYLSRILESTSQYRYALAQIDFSDIRLASAWEIIRADTLRYRSLPGDTLEKLLRSHVDFLLVAMAAVEAEGAALQAHAELLGLIPSVTTPRTEDLSLDSSLPGEEERERYFEMWPVIPDPEGSVYAPSPVVATEVVETAIVAQTEQAKAVPGPVPMKPVPPKPVSRTPRAVYVWGGDLFLLPERGELIMDELRESPFGRILLSFTSRGVAYLKEPEGRARLEEILKGASARGLRVELLLGDPHWILPKHRVDLVRLVSSLRDFSFSGLHLDLEPDQLPGAEGQRKELLLEMIKTLKAVHEVSPWPLGLSIHPRYLEGELGAVAAKGLFDAGVRETTVMIYSTNTQVVADRLGAIGRTWPGLNLSLAVSVERVLPPSESFFSGGRTRFLNMLADLERRLDAFVPAGIVVQAWDDYREMGK